VQVVGCLTLNKTYISTCRSRRIIIWGCRSYGILLGVWR